jgi:hypothetical protein
MVVVGTRNNVLDGITILDMSVQEISLVTFIAAEAIAVQQRLHHTPLDKQYTVSKTRTSFTIIKEMWQ